VNGVVLVQLLKMQQVFVLLWLLNNKILIFIKVLAL
jgi:hypothetical protein